MKKLLATLPLLALLSCTGIPPQHALSHFDWTEPADPQGPCRFMFTKLQFTD